MYNDLVIMMNLGRKRVYKERNVRDILGLEINRHTSEIVLQMARAAISNGIIPDKSQGKVLSLSYARPEIDVTGIKIASV